MTCGILSFQPHAQDSVGVEWMHEQMKLKHTNPLKFHFEMLINNRNESVDAACHLSNTGTSSTHD